MITDRSTKQSLNTQFPNEHKRSQALTSLQGIWRHKLKGKFSHRASRVKLAGTLIPCLHQYRSRGIKFKLSTTDSEYLLLLNTSLLEVAKVACWDEVTVTGTLLDGEALLEVKKLTINDYEDTDAFPADYRELISDVGTYTKIIDQVGKLDPAVDYMAS